VRQARSHIRQKADGETRIERRDAYHAT
jgi:hypothetical protein